MSLTRSVLLTVIAVSAISASEAGAKTFRIATDGGFVVRSCAAAA